MTRDEFKIRHSEILHYVQCIEHDLRIIYAALKGGDFEKSIDDLETATLGKLIKELKKADEIDGYPDLSDKDYKTLDEIREIRNYWCHQCYLDYVYIQDEDERNAAFEKIAVRLSRDRDCACDLHRHIEKIRLVKLKEYKESLGEPNE